MQTAESTQPQEHLEGNMTITSSGVTLRIPWWAATSTGGGVDLGEIALEM